MTSERTVLLVVCGLVAIALVFGVASAMLALHDQPCGELVTIAAGAVGGLAALLANTNSHGPAAATQTTTTIATADPAPAQAGGSADATPAG